MGLGMAQYSEDKTETGMCKSGGGAYEVERIWGGSRAWQGAEMGMYPCSEWVPQGWESKASKNVSKKAELSSQGLKRLGGLGRKCG